MTAAPERRWQALTLGLLLVGAAMAFLRPTDVDEAWLLTMGEKMLDGQRPYIDILETNPPMSILLYLPAIVLGRLIGVAPEILVILFVIAGIGASLWLSGRILGAAGVAQDTLWKLAAAGAFVFAVLPTGVFGQREHIVVIALAPFMALMIARAESARPHWILAALAGLGCGAAAAIKPHFALPAALAFAFSVWRQKSARPFFQPEVFAAAFAVALYAAIVLLIFPDFLRFLPLVSESYLPVRKSFATLLSNPPIPLAVVLSGLAIFTLRARRAPAGPVAIFLAAAFGGAAIYFIQGKAWPYQSYALIAFGALALAAAAIQGSAALEKKRLALIGACAALPLLAAMNWFTLKGDYHALNARVEAITPKPKLLSITADIAVGHPLVREIGGTWVGSVCSQWAAAGVITQLRTEADPARRARLETLMQGDRDRLVADIDKGRPDIILIETSFDWIAWAKADPALAAALAAYEPIETVTGIAIWARKDRARAVAQL